MLNKKIQKTIAKGEKIWYNIKVIIKICSQAAKYGHTAGELAVPCT